MSTLLEEIQAEAVDGTSDLGTLLRKCKLLAARLGSEPLENWLLWESNGYPADVEVPDYRVFSLTLKGHFSGPFGSGIRNAPIPMACLDPEIRDSYENYRCRQSVAGLEEMVRQSGEGVLTVDTGDLALWLGTKVYQNQNCAQAWAELGVGSLLELLNAVRNRILDFSLAIWKESPSAGEAATPDSAALDAARVTQIFNTTVYGGSANLVGSADGASISFEIHAGDFDSLRRALVANAVDSADIDALEVAIQQDEGVPTSTGIGPKVSSWIAKMTEKAANGTWTMTLGAAGNLLATAISKYYGM